MRIALIADIHHGADRLTKNGTAALGLLAEFAAWSNQAAPDLVIDLGDRITDRDRDHDIALETEVAEAFKAVNAPRFHLCGNHDRDFLSVEDNEAALGQSLASTTLDAGGWRIVLWRADSRIRRAHKDGMTGFVLPEADLLWLAAVIRAAEAQPAINAAWDGDAIVKFKSVGLSVAIAIDDGLVTPVIKQAEKKTLLEISQGVKDLAAKAKNKKLSPDDFAGGTITVSNLGAFGIDQFAAIINPPQAAIIAIGSIRSAPVVNDKGQIVVGQRMWVGLSGDHRVVDGAVAATFLAEMRKLLENPALMLV
jgi:hypothetical protein